jgi:release factor glutamine methyltransferase
LHCPALFNLDDAGSQPFGPLNIRTRPPVLIPRPETEHWVTQLASDLASSLPVPPCTPLRILDVGTGSGCIPLLLSSLLPPECAQLVGVDLDEAAVKLSRENAVESASVLRNSVRFEHADLFREAFVQSYRSQFDLILSNPPYITPAEFESLEPSVTNWESPLALVGSRQHQTEDGLAYYRQLTQIASKLLRPSTLKTPSLVVEVGHQQGAQVQELFKAALGGKQSRVEVAKDQFGVERTVRVYRGSLD